MLEEFLYTQELTYKPLVFKNYTPEMFVGQKSAKQIADCEVFNDFLDMEHSKEKNSIVNIPLKYWK